MGLLRTTSPLESIASRASRSIFETPPKRLYSRYARVVPNRDAQRRQRVAETALTCRTCEVGETSTAAATWRDLLRALSGEHEPEELVAWTMIEYNGYFGGALADEARERQAETRRLLQREARRSEAVGKALGEVKRFAEQAISAMYKGRTVHIIGEINNALGSP